MFLCKLQETVTPERVGNSPRRSLLHTPVLFCVPAKVEERPSKFSVGNERYSPSVLGLQSHQMVSTSGIKVSDLQSEPENQDQTSIFIHLISPLSFFKLLKLAQKACYCLPHGRKLPLGYILHSSLFLMVNYLR